jgi:HD-like signal output (HDOD) protein
MLPAPKRVTQIFKKERGMRLASLETAIDFIGNELAKNSPYLPTLPDVAIKIMNAVSKEETSPKDLAAIILTDPAISARLIRVTNSPKFRGRTEISNVQMAVLRLGNNTIRTLVSSMITQQLFDPSSKFLENEFKRVWEMSKNVSAVSHFICSFAPHLDPNEAMLAGLIHQVGKLPILTMIEQAPEFIEFKESPTLTGLLLEQAHGTVGKIVMDKLNFPATIKPVASEYNNFQYDSGAKADYVDVVQVAFLQSIAGTDHPACRIDCSTVPAFAKLGLSFDTETVALENISDNIELVASLFE